jgi:chemotaxis protein CheZ
MQAATVSTPSPDEALRAALGAELAPRLAELRSFVDRRIAELSAEVHASVELADMGETRISGEIARMHEQIAQLVAVPAAATRNSGLELEAVVQVTEPRQLLVLHFQVPTAVLES